MKFTKSDIEGVVVIDPTLFGDHRGYFLESFRDDMFRKEVCNTTFVQENESMSSKGVLRGLHFQRPPYSQSKLVRVVEGAALDVAVDIRKGSPTYGQYVAVELTGENHRQLFVPRGFAHGFVVLSARAIFQYKCDNFYTPQSEGSIAWNDPTIGVEWGVDAESVNLSKKDIEGVLLADFDSPFDYNTDLYE